MDNSSSSSLASANVPLLRTGVVLAQQSFLWEIDGFDQILKHDALINAQRIEFTAGVEIGRTSKWAVWFRVRVQPSGRRVIDVIHNIEEPPAQADPSLYSQLLLSLKIPGRNGDGDTWTPPRGADIQNIAGMRDGTGWCAGIIPIPETNTRKSLVLNVTHKLYFPKEQTGGQAVPAILEQFQIESTAKARMALSGLVQNPGHAGGDVRIRSRDGKEFTIPKGVLAARSPVFDAMFRSDMTEANSGTIDLPDITGKTLEILLNFLYTGELLHPGWKEGGVILELTNAAAKYQLLDLLEFLDSVLGKVCDLENVVPLFNLAHQLGLKTAEEELLKFVREKGSNSPDNFAQFLKVMMSSPN